MKHEPTTTSNTGGPLAGVRVIELGQYIAGPYAGKLLGDLGADVIKVEAPTGDPMRRWQGDSAYSPQFAAYNRNKHGVVLDLKSDTGKRRLRELVRNADVLVENFRPGVADRLGFGPSALADLNPAIISCSITGFGPTGPMSGRPSYDTVISAVGGMYSQIIPEDALRPLGPAFSDLLSGMSATQAILAALHARTNDGVGQHISISMVGALLDFLTESASTYLSTGLISEPDSRPRRAQAYLCTGSDGGSFVIHMSVPEKFWTGLLEVIERPDLAEDPRFAVRENRVANYDELDAVIKAETAKHPRAHWLERLAAKDIPHGPLNKVSELFDDPQIEHMNLVQTLNDADGQPTKIPLHSSEFSRSGRPEYIAAPRLGDVAADDVSAADERQVTE